MRTMQHFSSAICGLVSRCGENERYVFFAHYYLNGRFTARSCVIGFYLCGKRVRCDAAAETFVMAQQRDVEHPVVLCVNRLLWVTATKDNSQIRRLVLVGQKYTLSSAADLDRTKCQQLVISPKPADKNSVLWLSWAHLEWVRQCLLFHMHHHLSAEAIFQGLVDACCCGWSKPKSNSVLQRMGATRIHSLQPQ
jgi:hypothetical protein